MPVLSALRASHQRRSRRLVVTGGAFLGTVTLAMSAMSGEAQAQPLAGQATGQPASSVQRVAQDLVGDQGQYECFANIVERESGWDHTAQNPSSGAYGLVQALPGNKMASAGADWQTNPDTQIKWGLEYMEERYGSPCGAWAFWQNNHWY